MNILIADLRDLAAELKAESKARQAKAAANPPQVIVTRYRGGGFDALCALYFWITLLSILVPILIFVLVWLSTLR